LLDVLFLVLLVVLFVAELFALFSDDVLLPDTVFVKSVKLLTANTDFVTNNIIKLIVIIKIIFTLLEFFISFSPLLLLLFYNYLQLYYIFYKIANVNFFLP